MEVLCTSLLNSNEHPIEEFQALYHLRWNLEEAYKLLKSRIELERFSGKTALAVKQDFFAKVLIMSLCGIYSHPIEEKVRQEYKQDQDRKHPQKINRTSALAMTMELVVGSII